MRTTAGKKLYLDQKQAPPTRLRDTTALMKTRQRFLYRQRDQNGLPRAAQAPESLVNSRLHKHEFIPVVGKRHCKEKDIGKPDEPTTGLGLHEDEYDLKRQHDFFEHEAGKQRRLAGEFSRAFYYDNGEAVDEFGMKLTVHQRAQRAGKTQKELSGLDAEQQSTRSQSLNP